jgi:TRAP-type C4-dicarboxylate transport system permease small subunit
MKRIIRILFKLVNGGGALGAVILVFVWGSICINVAMRYLFGRPQAWAIELSEYAILYITFLGGAYVLKEEGHVKVDWVVGRLQPRSAALLEIANSVAGALLCLIITWYGVATTWSHYIRNIYRVTTLETPTFLILAVIPIGSFLLSVQFFRRAYEKMKIVRSSSENNRD